MKPPVLHIYGQGAWHDDVLIVGDRAALRELQATLELVLGRDTTAKAISADIFTNDGEGYVIRVLCLPEVPDNLAVPYSEDMAKERREGAVWPEALFEPASK